MTEDNMLTRWNAADPAHAAAMILPCSGCRAWANAMSASRPMRDANHLLTSANAIWHSLPATAWQEAFDSHPRIGEHQVNTTARSVAWSAAEQAAAQSDAGSSNALATANAAYEARFGRIFLICASGRSAQEILAEANRRMTNDDAAELREAVEQQQQIMALRLRRWLTEPS